jgi:putative endonuclease
MDANRQLGAWGEAVAARYLERHGFVILEQNVRTRFGELDLIARDGDTLVFIEVKTRRRGEFGSPALAVTWRKRRRISHLALTYLGDRPMGIRFDIIAITAPKGERPTLQHFRSAFDGVEPS